MKNNQITVGLVVVALVAVSFFGGMKYQESKVPTQRQFGNGTIQNKMGITGQNGNRAAGSGSRFGGQITGEITNADDKSITVSSVDGSSKIIFISTTTSIIKSTQATKTDLSIGTKVGVFGQTNTDGSVTAQNIQINPITMRPGTATPSASPIK